MRSRSLTAAIATVALATAVASALAVADRRSTARAAEVAPDTAQVRNGRVFLTAGQTAETRNAALWPAPVRSLLSVDHQLRHGEWLWNDRGVPAGPISVRVDLTSQLASVMRGGHEIGTAVILYGAEGHATPLGRFPILYKAADHHSRTYDAPMPYMLRLTRDGVAVHGSDVRWGVATHGCIGLPLAFARKLFEQAEPGDEVMILRPGSPRKA